MPLSTLAINKIKFRYLRYNSALKNAIKYLLISIAIMLSSLAYAQDGANRGNLSTYYHEKLHFGFTIGVNRSNFVIQNAEHFERFDSLKWIHSSPKTGFNLGIVSELRLHEYVTLRFVPNLSFAERNLEFYVEGAYDTLTQKKTIESTFLNFPLDLKLRSKRVGNFGAYILGGWSYSLDLASKRKTQNAADPNEQIVKLKRDDFGYEVGAGVEFYLQYFKFAIEGKLSMGTKNLLIKDNTLYSNSIDKLNSKVFLISLTFEG